MVTNIELVKDDVMPFIKNTNYLEMWSTEYFLKLVDLIKFETPKNTVQFEIFN